MISNKQQMLCVFHLMKSCADVIILIFPHGIMHVTFMLHEISQILKSTRKIFILLFWSTKTTGVFYNDQKRGGLKPPLFLL